jgi:hypothetical protein
MHLDTLVYIFTEGSKRGDGEAGAGNGLAWRGVGDDVVGEREREVDRALYNW